MSQLNRKKRLQWRPLIAAVSLVFIGFFAAKAEILPVKKYTTADGLLRDDIIQVEQDSRGFIWLRAVGGLMRFDGVDFKTYTVDDGLPTESLHWLQETTDGTFWISTRAGLVRFNPDGMRRKHDPADAANPDRMFQVFQTGSDWPGSDFGILVQTDDRTLWSDSDRGLIRIELGPDGPIFRRTAVTSRTTFLMKDSRGFLWIGVAGQGLWRMAPDESVVRFGIESGLPANSDRRTPIDVQSMMEDRDGRIWIGGHGTGGLCRLVADPQPDRRLVDVCYTEADGLSSNWIFWLHQTSDGIIWISTREKLTQLRGFDVAGRPVFRVLDSKNGLSDSNITDFEEDRAGNFWISSADGVRRVARQGFTRFSTADGLPSGSKMGAQLLTSFNNQAAVFESGEKRISVFNGKLFNAMPVSLPPAARTFGTGGKRAVFQAHDGEFWVTATPPAEFAASRKPGAEKLPVLLRFAKPLFDGGLASAQLPKIYRFSDLPPVKETVAVYEDRNRDVWIMGYGYELSFLYRWNRQTDTFVDMSEAADVGRGRFGAFAEDSSGSVWFGGNVSRRSDPNESITLLRYRHGRFEAIRSGTNTRAFVYDLLTDRNGRLWVATFGEGLRRIDAPEADAPTEQTMALADGLSDTSVYTLSEDKFGRIYAGTGRGIDQVDPETGRIRHMSSRDGLSSGEVYSSVRDGSGSLWFATATGLSRFEPGAVSELESPRIYVTGLRIAGMAEKISEFGVTTLPERELSADQNNLSLDFVGIGASPSSSMSFEYRIENRGSDWIRSAERTLNFANLSSGSYSLSIRAVAEDGSRSAPINFAFRILSPIYLRPWFIAIIVAAVGLIAWALYRQRLSRLIELERTRTRIATDLHDDIGAELVKIAMLSEVIRLSSDEPTGESERILTKIAASARTSVESMRDIVWAINPARDSLSELFQKMRQFAEEAVIGRDITLNFNVPAQAVSSRLSMDARREVYLIFKEAVSNAVKHSGCANLEINVSIRRNEFHLRVEDDGIGFDKRNTTDGNGLRNVSRRAGLLGGILTVETQSGTRLELSFPLR